MKETCTCSHHKVIYFLILLIALVFLLNGLGYVSAYATQIAWPIALGLVAIIKLFEDKCECC